MPKWGEIGEDSQREQLAGFAQRTALRKPSGLDKLSVFHHLDSLPPPCPPSVSELRKECCGRAERATIYLIRGVKNFACIPLDTGLKTASS